MATRVLVLIGTKKGAFILESDEDRQSFNLRGPFCEAWPINHMIGDAATGAIHAGGGNAWFGPAVWTSKDLGESWTHESSGLTYGEGEPSVDSVWSLAPTDKGRIWVGVEPAGLFYSDDGGKTFTHAAGLREHPSRPHWNPGAGGLILHHIVPHPSDPEQVWVAISSAGVFWTHDGGRSFEARNKGTRADFMPEDQRYPEWGQCVHGLVMAPGNPNLLYQQNHCGMYRSEDGGKNWQSIEDGLPSSFGFPVAAHPRDPDQVFLLPLNGAELGRYVPDGKAAVWHSRDRGKSWDDLRDGLPQENAYFGVLRQAMTVDKLDPVGIYFGTNSGTLYVSPDEGETFHPVAQHLPPISSVETMVLR